MSESKQEESKIQTEESKNNEQVKNSVVTLEEDDEFEDFPAEDWSNAEADISIPGGKEHLWEENWDDDDADDDFSNQLREELKKADGK
ncbi:DSS1/SEM1 family-domain-containing protein [Lipomyces japonicus]|uniref:DSS1/SEM1 family-domain-containing protein n=1 Tax=Lipomyces japonicus TaxID=56871 RepID=UPI0034D021DA